MFSKTNALSPRDIGKVKCERKPHFLLHKSHRVPFRWGDKVWLRVVLHSLYHFLKASSRGRGHRVRSTPQKWQAYGPLQMI